MQISKPVSEFIHRYPRRIYAGVVLFIVVCAVIIIGFCKFDSDVLDLLPYKIPSVQALKIFNNNFANSRQMEFLLLDKTGKVDLDGFRDHYAKMLRHAPWVERIMAQSPADNPNGFADLQNLALPLLLNMKPAEFQKQIALLQPDKIRQRLSRAHAEMVAGSMKTEFQLELDPTGILLPALKPLAKTLSGQHSSTQALTSPDGTARLILVGTNQASLGAHACQDLMRKVKTLNQRAKKTWDGPSPQILVTGRTPYVSEMSLDMRHDVVTTLLGSIILVSLIFFLGFRRIRPLIAILHVLLLCCIGAVAVGTLIFHSLNGITVGCCSILVGLGIDFGMLFYGAYQSARHAGESHTDAVQSSLHQIGRGVFFGAITTAAAFATLILSDCAGFVQLGALIGIGILFAALFMATLLFVFIGKGHEPVGEDWLLRQTRSYVGTVFNKPLPLLIIMSLVLVTLTILAFLPFKPLRFEANPQSLEPKNSQAGLALRTIQKKFPAAKTEPVIVLSPAKNQADFTARWKTLQQHWNQLVKRGEIKSFTSPAPLTLNPSNIAQNETALSKINVSESRAAFLQALKTNGFNVASFKNAFSTFDSLTAIAQGKKQFKSWHQILPKSSSWWFLLDRSFSENPLIGSATVFPNQTVHNISQKNHLEKILQVPGIKIQITGWSYIVTELAPWSKGKLKELSIVMIAFNLLLLIFIYRRFEPLFVLMLSLGLSIGAMIACLKFFNIPLNLFNVLAFPLVLGVGVDYGIYILLAFQQKHARKQSLTMILKPVLMSGLTTIAGFGSLGFATNPSLAGLGLVCAIGVAWCLLSTLFFILPIYVWRSRR